MRLNRFITPLVLAVGLLVGGGQAAFAANPASHTAVAPVAHGPAVVRNVSPYIPASDAGGHAVDRAASPAANAPAGWIRWGTVTWAVGNFLYLETCKLTAESLSADYAYLGYYIACLDYNGYLALYLKR